MSGLAKLLGKWLNIMLYICDLRGLAKLNNTLVSSSFDIIHTPILCGVSEGSVIRVSLYWYGPGISEVSTLYQMLCITEFLF